MPVPLYGPFKNSILYYYHDLNAQEFVIGKVTGKDDVIDIDV